MSWRDAALCCLYPYEWFFPPSNGDYSAGQLICAACPVRQECLDHAMQLEQPGHRFGLFGGLRPIDRQALSKPRKRIAATCGTNAGYHRHRRLKEAICDQCRGAHTADMKARRAA